MFHVYFISKDDSVCKKLEKLNLNLNYTTLKQINPSLEWGNLDLWLDTIKIKIWDK